MLPYIYYTVTVQPKLAVHLWQEGNYRRLSYPNPVFWETISWILEDETSYKIAYRGGHLEKPLFVILQSLRAQEPPLEAMQDILQQFLTMEGSPTKRLGELVGKGNSDFYDQYLSWLNHPLLLDIEGFDGRIYHNRFDRLEVQMQLKPSQTPESYLQHLELIFQTEAFQTVFQEKQYLLKTFDGLFHLPVNASTTDAQLTESFYTKGKLKDAHSVFIPRKYLAFTYFLKGELETLYQTYQERQPKESIRRRFGKDGAITRFGDFILSSGASAPMGFEISPYVAQKPWTSQVAVKRLPRAVRIDLTHIQATILDHTVSDKHFRRQLALVQKHWLEEPEYCSALNRLLYPIQGTMDTPFEQDLHTPRYAYSMRITHNLLLAGLLDALVADGMRPISLNNEVLFLDKEGLDEDRLNRYLDKLGTYYDYREVDNLLIKDTNNYTYYDLKDRKQIFRGGSFNHHEGADVTTNMDSPPIVDWVLQQMICELGDFAEARILDYIHRFIEESDLETVKEFLMVPLYPIKNRWGLLYQKDRHELICSARACFASTLSDAWWYSQLYQPRTGSSDLQAKDLVKNYNLPIEGAVKLVKNKTSRLEDMESFSLERVDKLYYAQLIANEIRLWR